MREHRNPRPSLAKRPSTINLRPRRARGLDPRAAEALGVLLDALASLDRRAAMRVLEALSAFVTYAAKDRRAP